MTKTAPGRFRIVSTADTANRNSPSPLRSTAWPASSCGAG